MAPGVGLDAREASAALRAGSVERLNLGFGRLVEAESKDQAWDSRDAMISLTPFIDCARRLRVYPSEVLGPIARTGPEWHRETFESFVQRTDITLAAFGWSIVDSALCRSWRSSGGLGRAHRKD